MRYYASKQVIESSLLAQFPHTGSRRRVLVPSSLKLALPPFCRELCVLILLLTGIFCQLNSALRLRCSLPAVYFPAGEDSHRPSTCAAFHRLHPGRPIQRVYDVLGVVEVRHGLWVRLSGARS